MISLFQFAPKVFDNLSPVVPASPAAIEKTNPRLVISGFVTGFAADKFVLYVIKLSLQV
jgi:hypothetical protein